MEKFQHKKMMVDNFLKDIRCLRTKLVSIICTVQHSVQQRQVKLYYRTNLPMGVRRGAEPVQICIET